MTKAIFQANIVLVIIYLVIAAIPVLKCYEVGITPSWWMWVFFGVLFIPWMMVCNKLMTRINNGQN
jgi:hypothetical protein